MNQQRLELENIRVCVILPICDVGATGRANLAAKRASTGSGSGGGNGTHTKSNVNYEATIESTFFSKPLISFTINAFER